MKARKMLGSANSPYIISLMRLIETQSKATLASWAFEYGEKNILPIYNKHYPNDNRPKNAIEAARKWMKGEVKFTAVKDIILNECHRAARESEENPSAQAAARALGQVAAIVHTPSHSLGLAFYGAAAIAYDKVGVNESAECYDKIASEVVLDMENELKKVAVLFEPNKAKIDFKC